MNLFDFLSNEEKDVIGEIGNISFGTASTALSMMLSRDVNISTPRVSVATSSELVEDFPKPFLIVSVDYIEGLVGSNVLMLKQEDAYKISDVLMGGEGTESGELTDLHISAIQEVMNQMMGMTATSMANLINKRVDISTPFISLRSVSDLISDLNSTDLIKVKFKITIEGFLESEIMQILTPDFAKELANSLL